MPGLRTKYSKTYELSDGRLQAELSTAPLHFRDRAGKWRDVDTRIGELDRPGYALGNTTNSFASLFGQRTDRLVRFELGGRWVGLGVAGEGRTLKSTVEGSSLSYRDVFGDADVRYQVTPRGLKEDIVVQQVPEESSFSFTLRMGGVEAREEADGSIGFYRASGGDMPLFVMPRPFMYDSQADAESPYGFTYSDAVTQTVEQRGANFEITVNADPDWLAAPERQYPVVIDPSFHLIPNPDAAKDSMILQDAPTTNFGSTWNLSVGTTTTGAARSLLQFDLSAIPAGSSIDNAELQLWYDQIHTTNDYAVEVEARQVTEQWYENGVTWNSKNTAFGQVGFNREQVDNSETDQAFGVGNWWYSTDPANSINNDWQGNNDAASTNDRFVWTPRITDTGDYEVRAHFVRDADRSTAAPYVINYDGGSAVYDVDQSGATGGVWKTLATHRFLEGTSDTIELRDDDTGATVSADAVRLTKFGRVTKDVGQTGRWHFLSVRNLVQDWVNGTDPNYGFMLKATDETTGRGGPRYESSEYAYNGETAVRPRLLVTYGRPSVKLRSITTMYSTGAELSWTAYQDPSTATGDDLVEYQVHRGKEPNFTPTAATLVAPLDGTRTGYTDTTADPEDAASSAELGDYYYYLVAVKTKDGELIPSSTQIARLPKAGRVLKVIQPDLEDTTLSSAKPGTNLDTLDGEPWLSVGNNSPTYGNTRAVLQFSQAEMDDIPASATVLEADLMLWKQHSFGSGGIIDAYPLNKDFTETEATWNRPTSSTTWTAGGAYSGPAIDSVSNMGDDPTRHTWWVDQAVADWVANRDANLGFLLRMRSETTAQQRVLFSSSEGRNGQLTPQLWVQYIEATPEDTYSADHTPERMIPGEQQTVPVTITNPTATTWPAGKYELSYRWELPDGTDVTTGGNQLATALPASDLVPGDTVTVQADLKTPIQSDAGNKRQAYVLKWDLRDAGTGEWMSQVGAPTIPPLSQNVEVEDPTSDQLGLETFYQYAGTDTGAGSTFMVNQAAGNGVLTYSPISNPSRGPSTFVRMTYNSQDTTPSVMGHGWSLQASTLTRLGSALQMRAQDPQTGYADSVSYVDGDGTTHEYTLNKNGSTDPTQWTYDRPAGVRLSLNRTGSSDDRQWVMTRPDRTKFYFDGEGFPTVVADKNGNELTMTYEKRRSQNQPTQFLLRLTDATGRQTLTLDYYEKGEDYDVFENGQKVSKTNLTNPAIIDRVASLTDISGRTVTLVYDDKGLLTEMVDGAGDPDAKTFHFDYDATQGMKNVKLVKVTDPLGAATGLAYYESPVDPQRKWWVQTITDRLQHATDLAYADPDGSTGTHTESVVTDALGNQVTYRMDGYGRPIKLSTTVDGQPRDTLLDWDADNNVRRLTEPNGAATVWDYDPDTGYPLSMTDAEAEANASAPTTLEYAKSTDVHRAPIADLIRKTSPEGRVWEFGYDASGNLTTVTDPKGTATATAGDYQSTNTYDAFGQLRTATDANGNVTTYDDYHPVGYPRLITDALDESTTFVYDARGDVTDSTDAAGKTTTAVYDLFGRPTEITVPHDQAGGDLSTTSTDYDANDRVVATTAANGAVTSYTYDAADRLKTTTLPKDSAQGPERVASYRYDKVGNLTSETEPKGELTAGNPDDYTTSYGYDEIYQLTSVVNASSDTLTYRYDSVGNLVTVVDPRKSASTDPDDYTTSYDYDLSHRLTTVTDAEGNTNRTGYDLDGLVVSTTDADGNEATYTLDERGMPTETKVPHKKNPDGSTEYRTTKYGYDEVGNRTTITSPRGVATGQADDFTETLVYDELNRVKERMLPHDPADAVYDQPARVFYSYDAVGNVDSVSDPTYAAQPVDVTRYEYFDDGLLRQSTDPWDITTAYDYTKLGQQKKRTVSSADDATSRTMSWSYYPDGKLASRSDDGVPVGARTVLVDDTDSQNTSRTGTWSKQATGTGKWGPSYREHAAGAGTDSHTWKLTIPQDGSYTVAVRYPDVAGAATAATYTVTHDGGAATQVVDQTAQAGTWVTLGSWQFKKGIGKEISVAQSLTGKVIADAVRLVRDNSADTDNEAKSFTYAYDANGNLTTIDDTSPQSAGDSYLVSYDGINQVAQVVQQRLGSPVRTTDFTYDANGNLETRTSDASDASAKDDYAAYTYDVRDLLDTVTTGSTPADPAAKVTSYTYTLRGERDVQTKPNGNTVDYGYHLDGLLATQVEKKSDGTLVSSHTIDYDPNGNRTSDVAKVMNADDHAAYLEHTFDYTYTPADRIEELTKTANGGSVLRTESYTYDAGANITTQDVDGTVTDFVYERNRLLSATTGGATASYNYDPYGRLDTVTTGAGVNATVLESYTYDGFDRVAEHTKRQEDGSTATTSYAYDALDRTTERTVGTKTRTFDYLGLSDQVLSEAVDGQIEKSYTYSPWGERLTQVKEQAAGGPETSYYGYNPHTDVETLTNDAGDTRATYGYTAYGDDDPDSFTGVDKPTPGTPDPTAEPYNAYRFNGKRYDPNTGGYDMGFRDYSPGLNRFLTRDSYNGALADMQLGTDPWNTNRYAFAGGNPITGVELDGHRLIEGLDARGTGSTNSADESANAGLESCPIPLLSCGSSPSFEFTPPITAPPASFAARVAEGQAARAAASRIPGAPKWVSWVSLLLMAGGDSVQNEELEVDKEEQGESCRSSMTSEGSSIYYYPLDDRGRATGAVACFKGRIPKDFFADETRVTPKGFEPGMHRGHLIARMLGGSNTRPENFVPLYPTANLSGMKRVENRIARLLNKGETVYYGVIPVYNASDVPRGLHMFWASESEPAGYNYVTNFP